MFYLDLSYFLPEVFFSIMLLILLIFGVCTNNRILYINKVQTKNLSNLTTVNILAIYIILFTLFLYICQYNTLGFVYTIFNFQVNSTNFIIFFKILILIFTLIILNISSFFFKQENIYSFEYVILLLLSSLGLIFFISANDFFIFYLALELQSLSLFILCAIRQKKNFSIEAGLKFFIIGSVSSGFLLFGCSLIYGNFGLLNFFDIKNILDSLCITHENDSILLIVGVLLVFVGFFFKLAIVPFHLWLKEIYEGAPTLVVMYIAIVPKLAIICVVSRFCQSIFFNIAYNDQISILFLVLSISTIFIGILGALFQKKIKSFIAYSSITNMGYVLYLLANINLVESDFFFFSISIFIILYAFTIFSLFTLILSLQNWSNNSSLIYLSQLSGLYKTQPLCALFFIVNLFSLIGLPPLAGFFGKFYISLQIINSGYYLLTFLFLLFGFFASIYYLKIIKLLFFDKINMSLFIQPLNLVITSYLSLICLLLMLLFIKPDYFFLVFYLFMI